MDMWKCKGQNREYITVTAHWAVENGEQKRFEMKNALLELQKFTHSAHTYNIRKSLRLVCERWISGEVPKFHVGVSDNASNTTLALKSETVLEVPEELRAWAMVEPEESDDDEENLFPPLAAMQKDWRDVSHTCLIL
ncbi:Hypothetical predicted protein [Paramuricea clavata]|uniref:Uncharacterized protein n=1 Tax=Paramuricea clavata TaxID=317549 RepID=A0A6S7HAP4_PARCT|nr:Hypothetical predicted protein [Paramuricea clavata]